MDMLIAILNSNAAVGAVVVLSVALAVWLLGLGRVKAALPSIYDVLGKFDELIKFAEKNFPDMMGKDRRLYVVSEFVTFFKELVGRELTKLELAQVEALVSERHAQLEAMGALGNPLEKIAVQTLPLPIEGTPSEDKPDT